MKVYVLTLQTGEYEDWRTWNVGVFLSMEDLEAAREKRMQEATRNNYDHPLCGQKFTLNDFAIEEWEIGAIEPFKDDDQIDCPHLDCWRATQPTTETLTRIESRLHEAREMLAYWNSPEGMKVPSRLTYRPETESQVAFLEQSVGRIREALA